MNEDNRGRYSKKQIWIHWSTAGLILLLYLTGFLMDEDTRFSEALLIVHIALGLAVLGLSIWRVWLRISLPQPAPIQTGNKINDFFIGFVHQLLYVLLLTVVITGLMAALKENTEGIDYGGEMNSTSVSHEYATSVLMALLFIHVGGVLRHYVLTKENPLKRIW